MPATKPAPSSTKSARPNLLDLPAVISPSYTAVSSVIQWREYPGGSP
jgi:hypothetical protein